MQKKLRLILAVSTMLVITAIIYGSLTWNQNLQQSGVQATQVLEEQGISIRTVDTTIYDNKDTESPIVSQHNQDTDNGKPVADEPDINSSPGSTEEIEADPTKLEDTAKSLLEIKQEYMLQFLELEADVNELLDEILEQAMSEYNELRLGNSTAKTSDIQSKYVIKILDLEKYSDREFNTIYKEFENDLAEHGYSKNEATPYRAKYNAEKQNRERRALEEFRALR